MPRQAGKPPGSAPSDESLAQGARAGDSAALDILLTRFKPLVKAKAAAYFLYGGDRDDLIQEGMIGLYKAVLDYAPEKNPVFSAFASLCINRQILTAIKTAARQKHAPLNDSYGLEAAGDNPPDSASAAAVRALINNPETLLINREASHDMAFYIKENLSPLEYDVLLLHIEGVPHAQIAAAIQKPLKSVDNTLQRIRRKVKRFVR